MMSYRSFAPSLGLLLALAEAGISHAATRPNVLFIAADDLRMNLGAYGDTIAQTPHLDRLAARSVVFNRAYCQQALCNPSRSSLLTGRRPDTLRVWNLATHFRDRLPEVITLPQHFKQQGYFTYNVGKIFHNWRTKIHGDPVSWSVPAVMHFASHSTDVPLIDGGELPPNAARTRITEAREVPDEAYFDGRVAALAVEALRQMAQGPDPFFLAVGFWKPHLPFNAPKRYWDQYRREDIPAITSDRLPIGAPMIAGHDPFEGTGPYSEDAEARRELRHGYYAATSYLDAQIGKVLDELDRQGLTEKTIIVFWSDHGFHLGEHGLWGKTTNFELDARVPLLISAPGFRQGVATDALVELLDLYPTLVDLCGLPAISGLEGVTLSPVLENPTQEVKPAAFTQHPRPAHITGPGEVMGYSIRTGRYRYTEWRDWQSGRAVALELYDHASDADEINNLAGQEGLIAKQLELAAMLDRQFPPQALPAN